MEVILKNYYNMKQSIRSSYNLGWQSKNGTHLKTQHYPVPFNVNINVQSYQTC